MFVLFALFAPTLLPGGAKQGWAGELLQRVNPITAAEHYMRNIVINQYDWTKELDWLVSPLVAGVGFTLIAVLVVPRFIGLRGGSPG
jgi:ABC-2 type transport system permease protein